MNNENFGDTLPRISNVGRSIFDPIWAIEEHTDPASELLHVLRGEVTIKTRSYSIVGGEGDTIYIPAGIPHQDVFPLDSIFEVYLIQFYWPGEQAMLEVFDPTQLAKISGDGRHRIAGEINQLYQDFTIDRPYSRQIMQARLLQIIYHLCQESAVACGVENRAADDFSTARRVQIMTRARHIIQERFSRPITLDTIAEALDISPYYLSRVFSEESGFTLSSYLTTVRMEHAVELLKDPSRTVEQVALATGFKDSHYFRRVFKAHFNASPKAYRARLIRDEK